MSDIIIKNLSFNYEGSHDLIFENVNLSLNTDWKLGLVGRNGKGKTTLLKLLTGELEYSGKINSSMQFEYFPYLLTDKRKYVYEIIQEINPDYEEWRIIKELNLLEFGEVDFYRPFDTYSNGEQTKILLAVMFTKFNTFLLIDEPTNHLDSYGRKVLSQYLRKKRSFIIVSHDKSFIDGCVDHILSINRADIEIQAGNMSSFLSNKQMKEAAELNENERLRGEIHRLKESVRHTTDWSLKAEKSKWNHNGISEKKDRGYIGAKAARLMKRATVMKGRMIDTIEEKSGLLKNIDTEEKISIISEEFFKDTLLSVENLIISYYEKEINKPLSFNIFQGDKIALNGKNGSGKTSVFKAILGESEAYKGVIKSSNQLKISYVSQDTSYLCGKLDDFCFDNEIDKTKLYTIMIKLGFSQIDFIKSIETYSEGQKKKLLIAQSLSEKANLFLWDEPLNYIDILARQQIKKMLQSSNISMIFVEHDADFCCEISNKEIVIERKF